MLLSIFFFRNKFQTNIVRLALFLAIALLIPQSSANASGIKSGVDICSNVVDNLFLPHISNCSEYYLCIGGIAFPKACDPGYYFDARDQMCVIAEQARCLPSCPPHELTSFCYDRTCTKYVLCYMGTPVVRECCDGLQYNADTDRCDYPQYVDCVDNLCMLQTQVDIDNIVYIASKANCNKYYICVYGQPQNQTCTSGLQFNPSCNCCDFPSRVNCTVENLQRNIIPFAKAPPRRADIICPENGIYFYQHHTRLDAYYYCLNGRGVVLDCTPGLVYDVQQEECRDMQH
ncbi:protein obstructor-E-like [Scaptodrosophila lebanonensis]|uniref:Protein obstructor-E-like n=1 Tax=Drosophila lebanonensis TaxID=7225 RepID=A0A6J2TJN0_DROLE|nr:protein obstructor-E-like [Scaptodrosophila lebanonensis]